MTDNPNYKPAIILTLVFALLISGGLLLFMREDPEKPEVVTAAATPEKILVPAEITPSVVNFTDITTQAGISFQHVNGAYGDRLLPETMGSGVAFFDYDNDGDQDLLLVNSRHWPGHETQSMPTHELYANDGTGKFTNVTQVTGLDASSYGMGVSIGDIDNDGWQDIFITCVGRNMLFMNREGTFTDMTEVAGVSGSDEDWSTASTFFDMDNDGDLDLFVANYVHWSKEIDLSVNFQLVGIGRAYGPPTAFEGTFAYLYENNGAGAFTDISADSGIQVRHPATGAPMAKALAVALLDFDNDGQLDLAVANDTVQNFLFHNLGNGRFRERGTDMGLAYDRYGHATGAMGIDTAHYRNDDTLGIVIGNFANEMSSLYVSDQSGQPFSDDAIIEGIGPASRRVLSFATLFFDYDLDGYIDLLEVNGHIEKEINRVQSSQQYAQSPQIFWNCGDQCDYAFLLAKGGDANALFEPIVGRGAAYADIDKDGDLDLVLTQTGGQARLLRNDTQTSNHWLRLKLVGNRSNRDAIGARMIIDNGMSRQIRYLTPTRGYLSQMELPQTFGLGQSTKASLEIRWPDGTEQKFEKLPFDQSLKITQGKLSIETM